MICTIKHKVYVASGSAAPPPASPRKIRGWTELLCVATAELIFMKFSFGNFFVTVELCQFSLASVTGNRHFAWRPICISAPMSSINPCRSLKHLIPNTEHHTLSSYTVSEVIRKDAKRAFYIFCTEQFKMFPNIHLRGPCIQVTQDTLLLGFRLCVEEMFYSVAFH
jgi:hypothetical protein